MFKKHAFKLLAIFQVVLLAILFLSISPASPSQAAAVKIMPLGDSITGSPGCWRSILWNRLQNTGYTNIDFVGTLPPQGCALPHDGDNEGHGGILATNMADQNQLPGWLSTTNPDVVLMHLGTNDVWSARSTTTILNAFSNLVDQMRANNPNMKIIVAKIIPMDPARSCSDCDQRVIALNNALSGWANGKSTAQSPIVVVDQWTGFSTSSDTYDGVHPNSSGDQKMSDKWYPALISFLGATPTSVPPTSVPPTGVPPTGVLPTSVPPTTGPGVCTVNYAVQNQWGSGATVNVTVGNNGSSAIDGWTLTWTYPGNQQINQMWGGSYSQSGASVSVTHISWNRVIPANGGTAGFGMNLTFSGANNPPTNFVLNGTPCNGGPQPTQVPPTSVPPTGVPPTSVPPTSVPPTTVPPTSVPPTSVPPTSVPPTTGPGTCTVSYVSQNDWGSGATVNVTVRNSGTSAVNGWTLTWTFPGNQQITNLWNGTYTQSGASVSVRNAGWNANIGANGGTVSLGFNLNYSGTNVVPVSFSLNGMSCQY